MGTIENPNSNFFRFDTHKVNSKISRIPAVGSALVTKKFPNSVKIYVTEAVPLFSLRDDTKDLILDLNLKVIEIRPAINPPISLQTNPEIKKQKDKKDNSDTEEDSKKSESEDDKKEITENIQEFAVIEGVNIQNIKAGQKLQECRNSESEKIESLKAVIDALKENNLINELNGIDVRNINAITIILKNRSILKLGDTKDLGKKIGCYIKIREKLDKDVNVRLDLSVPGKCFLK